MKNMLELKQTVKNRFSIVDGDGCMVSGTKEELNGLYQQLIRIKDEPPQEKENLHTVLLEDDYNDERVQMELSDSAYRLLRYLYNENWFRSDDMRLTEVDDINFKNFV